MKYLFKYLIKLLFVVVVPVLMTIVVVNLLVYQPVEPILITGFLIMTVLSFVNAIFWSVNMSRVFLIPRIKINSRPGIGLDVEKVAHHWEVKLPFIVLIFQRRL